MENNLNIKQKAKKINEYYSDKGLLLVGLNDSQGVNVNSMFLKKGLLEYLAYLLTSKELKPEVINAFSLLMNKTEHVDYFLKHNLTLEEIKLSQIYSVVSAFENVMKDINLPQAIGSVGNVYRLIYTPKKGDKDKKITTLLKEANEPILIYSSGVNNLMREVGANPFCIKKDYKNRFNAPNYYYTLDKSEDPNTIKKVMNDIDKNFNNILSVNSSTDIYTLGAYIPKSLNSEEMKTFKELVLKYNEELKKICKEYNITFIDTEKVGQNSESNFHITTKGHNALAITILNHIYDNKFILDKNTQHRSYKEFEIKNLGSQGMVDVLNEEGNKMFNEVFRWQDYESYRRYKIVKEKIQEKEIFQKVLNKTNK